MELVFTVPFVLMLLAAAWDLRQYSGYRAELAREVFVVAEAIGNEPGADPSPIGDAMESLKQRLGRQRLGGGHADGSLQAAVVVRGTLRHDGTPCDEEGWCAPLVTLVWPSADTTEPWGESSECAGPGRLPRPGDHFTENALVLPGESAATGEGQPARPTHEWISRNMDAAEWWVVVDTCFDPPGLSLLSNLARHIVDTSFALRTRAAWRSIHDREGCTWCEP